MSFAKAHQPLFVLRRHNSAVMTCAFDPAGHSPHLLLSGDMDGVVLLWDLELRKALMGFSPAHSAAGTLEQQTPVVGFAHHGILKVGFLTLKGCSGEVGEERFSVCFYTQCRNRKLHIWRATLNVDGDDVSESELNAHGASLDLLYVIDVPQHGFCTIPSVHISPDEVVLAVPHDSGAVISLWNVAATSNEGESPAGLNVFCSKSFSAAGSQTKCGTIMCVNFRDSSHFVAAFESGHVTLNNTGGERLAIVRAFSETALACVWSENTVLISSAEGQLHCYTVVGNREKNEEVTDTESDTISLVVQWEVSLRKGLGSMALQRHLVIVGSWDHTLRLYDEGSGSIISILTFHAGSVSEIAIAPFQPSSSTAAVRPTLFGYDVRKPRWCETHTSGNGSSNRSNFHEDESVYLFASASVDFTIGVWRVDFKMLCPVAITTT